MNRPELYRKVNSVQRHEAERILKRFATKIQWRYDGCDSLIDVGSGSGDVLMDFIYPMMPSSFQRLVCSDINPNIVNYAKTHYGHFEKSEFKVLNIGSDNELPQNLKEQFDHVMSFYTMMWVQNQRQGLRNIYQLLRREGGDCLLVFLASHPIYKGYKRLSQMQRWSKFMKDVDDFIAPLQYSEDPANEYAEYMKEMGFTNLNVEATNRTFIFDSLDDFKVSMIAVNPWIDRIPLSLQNDFINDLISITIKIMGLNPDTFIGKTVFPLDYRLLIAYGRKCAAADVSP